MSGFSPGHLVSEGFLQGGRFISQEMATQPALCQLIYCLTHTYRHTHTGVRQLTTEGASLPWNHLGPTGKTESQAQGCPALVIFRMPDREEEPRLRDAVHFLHAFHSRLRGQTTRPPTNCDVTRPEGVL